MEDALRGFASGLAENLTGTLARQLGDFSKAAASAADKISSAVDRFDRTGQKMAELVEALVESQVNNDAESQVNNNTEVTPSNQSSTGGNDPLRLDDQKEEVVLSEDGQATEASFYKTNGRIRRRGIQSIGDVEGSAVVRRGHDFGSLHWQDCETDNENCVEAGTPVESTITPSRSILLVGIVYEMSIPSANSFPGKN